MIFLDLCVFIISILTSHGYCLCYCCSIVFDAIYCAWWLQCHCHYNNLSAHLQLYALVQPLMPQPHGSDHQLHAFIQPLMPQPHGLDLQDHCIFFLGKFARKHFHLLLPLHICKKIVCYHWEYNFSEIYCHLLLIDTNASHLLLFNVPFSYLLPV